MGLEQQRLISALENFTLPYYSQLLWVARQQSTGSFFMAWTYALLGTWTKQPSLLRRWQCLKRRDKKKKTPKQGIGFVSKSTQWTCLSSEDNLLYRTYVTSYHLEIPLKARLVSFSCFLAVEWLSEFRFCFTSSAPIKESFLFPFPFRSWLSVGSQVTDVFFYSWIFVALSSRRIDRGNFIIRQFLQYF